MPYSPNPVTVSAAVFPVQATMDELKPMPRQTAVVIPMIKVWLFSVLEEMITPAFNKPELIAESYSRVLNLKISSK